MVSCGRDMALTIYDLLLTIAPALRPLCAFVMNPNLRLSFDSAQDGVCVYQRLKKMVIYSTQYSLRTTNKGRRLTEIYPELT